jgi:hypothetical protein
VQLASRYRPVTVRVRDFLVIIYRLGLPRFVEVTLQPAYLCKTISYYLIFHNHTLIEVIVEFALSTGHVITYRLQ